ncbi:Myb-like, SWIRM and MPN domains 1 [Mortierella sp. GBA30]|nr:Myb-like, SWIRM and MPN domains 1 [Mortierella sp. GBA30]
MADEEDIDIEVDIDIDGDEPEGPPKIESMGSADAPNQNPMSSAMEATFAGQTLSRTDSLKSDADSQDARSGMTLHETTLEDEFQIPDWVTQDYHAQAGFGGEDMDEKSRKMIESMLAEEEFYSGRTQKAPSTAHGHTSMTFSYASKTAGSSVTASSRADPSWTKGSQTLAARGKSQDTKKRKSSNERSGQSKRTASEDSRLNAKLSSADLPSHNTRWTPEEDERLREGITPHDVSTSTSDGEGLERRPSAANSADEDVDRRHRKMRQPRSKHVKRIDASASAGTESGYESFGRRGRRARSITSESGNDDFTGSEFGATSGYDTDNDEDRSASKSPSLSAKSGSRPGSVGLGTPSPGLRPLYSPVQRATLSMDEDEDIDVDIESTDEESSSRMKLTRSSLSFVHKSKSRSISPFSNSSTRSRLSSEFDSNSDRDMDGDNDDVEEVMDSGHARKLSPTLSDTHGSLSDPYTTPNFNTSSSSINSNGGGNGIKPLLKDGQQQQSHQQQLHSAQLQKGYPMSHISLDKISNSPKERRTVSFGAVHVAELQPDLNSYDENSSEDGGFDTSTSSAVDVTMTPSPLSNSLYDRASLSGPHLLGIDNTQGGKPTTSGTVRNSPINGSHSRHTPSVDRESDDDDEEEGNLGTGTKRTVSIAITPSLSRKVQRAGPSKPRATSSTSSAHVTGQSVPYNQQPMLIPPGQASIAPAMAMSPITPVVTPRVLDKSIITEEEKQVHSEFFCNKASKTPERYQRIRNTILQAWEKSPSTYLTKTSVRSGLKDCGDVNAIGRVHSWLESIGAINVGMTASSPGASLARPRNRGNTSAKRRGHSEERGWSSSSSSSAPRRGSQHLYADLDDLDSVWAVPPLRRRRVRNERGDWVDERELEGRVIDHSVHNVKNGKHSSRRSELGDDLLSLDDEAFLERHGMTKEEMEEEYEQERLAAQNARYFAATELLPVNTRVPKNRRAQHLLRQTRGFHEYEEGDDTASGGYDPFRLVPLRKYSPQSPAPFRVKVSSDAMLIMDFHSHLAETEVIGLLGGLYDEDEKILFILGVFPCRSISTGLQCEMDPESDVEARFFFSSKGFVVVGWYHSHPTFEPNPSIRDIENQSEHQTMFRRPELGVEPFVGVIVSPFDPTNLSFLSKFQFLSVSEQFDEAFNCRLPFGYDREITRTNELSVSVFQQLSDLVRYYRTYEHRVDLSRPLRKGESMTRLDKLLKSLSHHIFVDENTARVFLSKVRELVVRGFQLDVDRVTNIAPATAGILGTDITASSTSSTTTFEGDTAKTPNSSALSDSQSSRPLTSLSSPSRQQGLEETGQLSSALTDTTPHVP